MGDKNGTPRVTKIPKWNPFYYNDVTIALKLLKSQAIGLHVQDNNKENTEIHITGQLWKDFPHKWHNVKALHCHDVIMTMISDRSISHDILILNGLML